MAGHACWRPWAWQASPCPSGRACPGTRCCHQVFPLLQGTRATSRFGYLGLFAVAGLAAFGLAHLRRRVSPRAGAALAARRVRPRHRRDDAGPDGLHGLPGHPADLRPARIGDGRRRHRVPVGVTSVHRQERRVRPARRRGTGSRSSTATAASCRPATSGTTSCSRRSRTRTPSRRCVPRASPTSSCTWTRCQGCRSSSTGAGTSKSWVEPRHSDLQAAELTLSVVVPRPASVVPRAPLASVLTCSDGVRDQAIPYRAITASWPPSPSSLPAAPARACTRR